MGDLAPGAAEPVRGVSRTTVREVSCKDCLREAQAEEHPRHTSFQYPESWAERVVDRGGSRTDRCARHRQEHRRAIQGLAVAYIDLHTIGEVRDRASPTGPLGGLGALPDLHRAHDVDIDLAPYEFGMTDSHIIQMLTLLKDKRVLILKAGTGTGKSTFAPFRLMSPPVNAPLRLTDFGPIIVTEPRIQATIGVARFVGEKLVVGCKDSVCLTHGPLGDPDVRARHSDVADKNCVITDCTAHIGPGRLVGYQIKGDKNHDDTCRLVYVTDGTMFSWLRDGRLSRIGTVIVDEAHERNTNIDFILAYLRSNLDRYPHIRVIVTSATFDVDFYISYFGGPEKVAQLEVPAVKAFGYGAPLFPLAGGCGPPCLCDPPHEPKPASVDEWIALHWPTQKGPVLDDGSPEDLWDTTRKLNELRLTTIVEPSEWRTAMPDAVADFVARLANRLDELQIYGDILAFLATEKTITATKNAIESAVNLNSTDVYGLLSTIDNEVKAAALAARSRGDKRKIVISSNLAETSLTVSGVRFIVDSGLICQEEWDPNTARKELPTKPHSQAGLQQRWGRVGRDLPGWVFPLYSLKQFRELARNTPPGSTRASLEPLFMKAKAAGIDDPARYPWPATHADPTLAIDASGKRDNENFARELKRSQLAVKANGVLDEDGYLTPFGSELERFTATRSAVFGIAVMLADQLACVPEVVTALALLEDRRIFDTRGLFPENVRWRGEWRVEAWNRRRALMAGCTDDLELVLRTAALWDRAATSRPWEDSSERRAWAETWFASHDLLLAAAQTRREILEVLSPAMKEEVKRFLHPGLTNRARAVLSQALRSLQYQRRADGKYTLTLDASTPPGNIQKTSALRGSPDRIIALSRKRAPGGKTALLDSVVVVYPWAAAERQEPMALIRECARHLPRTTVDLELVHRALTVWPVGTRFEARLEPSEGGGFRAGEIRSVRPPTRYAWRDRSAALEAIADPTLEVVDDVGEAALLDGDTGDRALAFDEGVVANPGGSDTDADSSEAPVEVTTDATASDIAWPTGNRTPAEDEEIIERWAVLDTSDDPSDPEKGLEANDDESTIDLVRAGEVQDVLDWTVSEAERAWLERPVVSLDRISAEPADPANGYRWFRCVGYTFREGGETELRLAEDWQNPDSQADPSDHADLEPGTSIEVVVGRVLKDRTTAFREFVRKDRRGRFLLDELPPPASGRRLIPPRNLDAYCAESLTRYVEGAVLTGVVVSDSQLAPTLTLCPSLMVHLAGAMSMELTIATEGKEKSVAMYPAVVTEPPKLGWGEVELLHRDTASGVRHSFRVEAPLFKSLTGKTKAGRPVLVELRLGPPPTLFGRREVLNPIQARFPALLAHRHGFVAKGPGDCGIIATRPLSREAFSALLAADSSKPWAAIVSQVYVASHRRRVVAMDVGSDGQPQEQSIRDDVRRAALSLFARGTRVLGVVTNQLSSGLMVGFRGGVNGFAGIDFCPQTTPSVGTVVTATVRSVNNDTGQLRLDLRSWSSAEGPLPQHWRASARSVLVPLVSDLGGEVAVSAERLSLSAPDDEGLVAAMSRVHNVLASPAVAVDVPQQKRALVVGSKGSMIRQILELPGVYSWGSLGDQGYFVLVAESDVAIRSGLEKVLALVQSECIGKLVVPEESVNGLLIGRGGTTIKRLKAESGCYFTEAVRGSREWNLRARNPEQIEKFGALANTIVRGCTTVIVDSGVTRMIDVGSGESVGDWKTHKYSAYKPEPLLPIVHSDAVDLRPEDTPKEANTRALQDRIAAEIRLTLEDSEDAVPLPKLAQLLRSSLGTIVDTSGWAGAGSFQKLLREHNWFGFSFDASSGGRLFDPTRHEGRTGPAATGLRRRATPELFDQTNRDQLKDSIVQVVTDVVERSDSPVPLTTLTHAVVAAFGPEVHLSKWADAGSFKALLVAAAPDHYEFIDAQAGYLHDPRHQELPEPLNESPRMSIHALRNTPRKAPAPGVPLEEREEVRSRVVEFVKQFMATAPEAVTLSALGLAAIEHLGKGVKDHNWAGFGGLKGLLHKSDLGGLVLTAGGPGFLYDPARHKHTSSADDSDREADPIDLPADLEDIVRRVTKSMLQSSEEAIRIADIANRLRAEVGPDLVRSEWAGAGSVSALLRCYDFAGFTPSVEPPGYLFDPERHEPPRQHDGDDSALRAAMVEFLREVIDAAGQPVALGSLAHRLKAKFGAEVKRSNHAGTGSITALCRYLAYLGYRVNGTPPGNAYNASGDPDELTVCATVRAATGAPALNGKEYRAYFGALAARAADAPLSADAASAARELLKDRGVNITSRDALAIVSTLNVAVADDVASRRADGLAAAFATAIIERARAAKVELSEGQAAEVKRWLIAFE